MGIIVYISLVDTVLHLFSVNKTSVLRLLSVNKTDVFLQKAYMTFFWHLLII